MKVIINQDDASQRVAGSNVPAKDFFQSLCDCLLFYLFLKNYDSGVGVGVECSPTETEVLGSIPGID